MSSGGYDYSGPWSSHSDFRRASNPYPMTYDRPYVPPRRRSPSPVRRYAYDSYVPAHQESPYRDNYPNVYRPNVYRPDPPSTYYNRSPSPDRYVPSHVPEPDSWDRSSSWQPTLKAQTWPERRPSSPPSAGRDRPRRDSILATRMFEPSEAWKQSHDDHSARTDGVRPAGDRYPDYRRRSFSPERRDRSPPPPGGDRYRPAQSYRDAFATPRTEYDSYRPNWPPSSAESRKDFSRPAPRYDHYSRRVSGSASMAGSVSPRSQHWSPPYRPAPLPSRRSVSRGRRSRSRSLSRNRSIYDYDTASRRSSNLNLGKSDGKRASTRSSSRSSIASTRVSEPAASQARGRIAQPPTETTHVPVLQSSDLDHKEGVAALPDISLKPDELALPRAEGTSELASTVILDTRAPAASDELDENPIQPVAASEDIHMVSPQRPKSPASQPALSSGPRDTIITDSLHGVPANDYEASMSDADSRGGRLPVDRVQDAADAAVSPFLSTSSAAPKSPSQPPSPVQEAVSLPEPDTELNELTEVSESLIGSETPIVPITNDVSISSSLQNEEMMLDVVEILPAPTAKPPSSDETSSTNETSQGPSVLRPASPPAPAPALLDEREPTPVLGPAEAEASKVIELSEERRSQLPTPPSTVDISGPVSALPRTPELDIWPEEMPNFSEAKSTKEALRVVVMTRLLCDQQTREERVNPVLMANRTIAALSHEPRPSTSVEEVLKEVAEGERFKTRLQSFDRIKDSLGQRFKERQAFLEAKAKRLKEEYLALHRRWVAHCAQLDEQSKPPPVDLETVHPPGRTTRRSTANLGDAVRSDLEMEQIIASLGNDEATDPAQLSMKNLAPIPDMISVLRGKVDYLYDDTNHVVDYPKEYYGPQTGIHDWTDQEKEIFLDKFAAHPKQFGIIAEFIPNKTAAQCVDYYYLHKKKLIDFRKVISQYAPNKRRRRGTGKKKSNALLTDIRQHDAMVQRVSGVPPTTNTNRSGRGKKGAPSAETKKPASTASARKNGVQFGETPTSTPTPEPEARQRRRRTAATTASRTASNNTEDVEEDATEPEPPAKRARRTRRIKSVAIVTEELDTATTLENKPSEQSTESGSRRRSQNNVQWSDEDKELFLKLLAQHGDDFKRIAAAMPNKTMVQVSNYYKAHVDELGLDKIVSSAPKRSPTPETREAWKELPFPGTGLMSPLVSEPLVLSRPSIPSSSTSRERLPTEPVPSSPHLFRDSRKLPYPWTGVHFQAQASQPDVHDRPSRSQGNIQPVGAAPMTNVRPPGANFPLNTHSSLSPTMTQKPTNPYPPSTSPKMFYERYDPFTFYNPPRPSGFIAAESVPSASARPVVTGRPNENPYPVLPGPSPSSSYPYPLES